MSKYDYKMGDRGMTLGNTPYLIISVSDDDKDHPIRAKLETTGAPQVICYSATGECYSDRSVPYDLVPPVAWLLSEIDRLESDREESRDMEMGVMGRIEKLHFKGHSSVEIANIVNLEFPTHKRTIEAIELSIKTMGLEPRR